MPFHSIRINTGLGDPVIDSFARQASTASSFADLAFTTTDLDETFPDLTLGATSCLLRFAGPGDNGPITFLATTAEAPTSTYYYVKRGEGEVRTDSGEPITDARLGNQPICGYSVVTEESDNPLGAVGDTLVYFLVQGSGDTDPVKAQVLVIPTSSEESMTDYFTPGSSATRSEILLDLVEAVDRSTIFDNNAGQKSRAAATVWLGDNRSLIVPSYSTDMFQFDANSGSFSALEEPETARADSNGILFACKATQKDRENMGCA